MAKGSVWKAVTFGLFVDMTMILVFNAVNKLIIVAMNVKFVLFAMYLTVEHLERIWFKRTRSHTKCDHRKF